MLKCKTDEVLASGTEHELQLGRALSERVPIRKFDKFHLLIKLALLPSFHGAMSKLIKPNNRTTERNTFSLQGPPLTQQFALKWGKRKRGKKKSEADTIDLVPIH